MFVIITLFDHPSIGPPPFRLIGTGPSDRRPFRRIGPALSGHFRRQQAAAPRRAGALDPREMNLMLATFFSYFCFELGTTVGYSTAFLATFVAGKRQLFGALSRQALQSGFLGWPLAALAFTFPLSNFLGFLTTTWPPATRGKLLAESKARPKAWPRATWKTSRGVLNPRTTPWPTTARQNPANRKKKGAGNLASDHEENKQHCFRLSHDNLATSKAKKATGEKQDEDLANSSAQRRKEDAAAWPPWELLYLEDMLVPVRLWRSGTATRSRTSWPSSSETACMRLIHSIHDHYHYHHRH